MTNDKSKLWEERKLKHIEKLFVNRDLKIDFILYSDSSRAMLAGSEPSKETLKELDEALQKLMVKYNIPKSYFLYLKSLALLEPIPELLFAPVHIEIHDEKLHIVIDDNTTLKELEQYIRNNWSDNIVKHIPKLESGELRIKGADLAERDERIYRLYLAGLSVNDLYDLVLPTQQRLSKEYIRQIIRRRTEASSRQNNKSIS